MLSVLFSFIKPNKLLLLLGSVGAVIGGILLQNIGLLPLDEVTFLFFSFVLLLFILYRPGWGFLLFVAMLPLEIINVAPTTFGGFMLRPYQWLASILLVAVAIRFGTHTLPFRLWRFRFFDAFPLFLIVGSFVSLVGAPIIEPTLKQVLVVLSFVAIYFLGRIFFRTLYDVGQAAIFFVSSSIIVFCYALWQNVAFLSGKTSFAVMAGRPNATFSEADWLGMFTVGVLGVAYLLLQRYLFLERQENKKPLFQWLSLCFASVFLVLTYSVLIITVARSAWLGALVLTLIFSLGLLFWSGVQQWHRGLKKTTIFSIVITILFSLAVLVVSFFHLSPFQLLNRIYSTGSGLQKITLSCLSAETILPDKISESALRERNDCRHILLEEINQEKAAGRFIFEVYRDDPTISIRKEIYGTVVATLKEHFVLGIGWGNATLFLGVDERGAGLNASNVFLEVWLGSGLIGLVAFLSWWLLLAWATLCWYYGEKEEKQKLFALFLFSTLCGITVFNFFNSGILLGFFFLFLSVGALGLEQYNWHFFAKKDSL